MEEFQSTLPVRGATAGWATPCSSTKISIHAPRAGSDLRLSPLQRAEYMISIHAPRAGSDAIKRRYINITAISIHAPRAGSDEGLWAGIGDKIISIHAPRAGSDPSWPPSSHSCWHFNPRSPCGERLIILVMLDLHPAFQSTLPVRGATRWPASPGYWPEFQSTLPVRGATFSTWHPSHCPSISIHAPRAGSDGHTVGLAGLRVLISIHAPRAGSDRWPFCPLQGWVQKFQSTLPVRGATADMHKYTSTSL